MLYIALQHNHHVLCRVLQAPFKFLAVVNRFDSVLELTTSTMVSCFFQRVVPCVAFLIASAVFAGQASAACSTANQYNFSFANQPAATLNYANTYSYTATSTALGNQNFSVSFFTNGLSSTVVAGIQMPAINGTWTDGVAVRNLAIGGIFSARTADVTSNTRVVRTILTFPQPVRDVTFQLNDVDFGANQFRDWINIEGTGAATYGASMVTPFGNNNGATGPKSATNSTMLFGISTTPVNVTTVRQAVGTAVSGNNSTNGTVTASFAEPVTSVSITYANYPFTTGETVTGQQAIGIQSISYCPMPALTFVKSSTPYATGATDPLRFNIPGSDVAYSLTVSNSDSSPVDLNAIVLTDILPPTLTFRNSDYDDAGPLTSNFEFLAGSSGLTFAGTNLTYSNNGGTSYAYTSAAGYDTNVSAIRLNPQGAMAANSSFTLRFRARIK